METDVGSRPLSTPRHRAAQCHTLGLPAATQVPELGVGRRHPAFGHGGATGERWHRLLAMESTWHQTARLEIEGPPLVFRAPGNVTCTVGAPLLPGQSLSPAVPQQPSPNGGHSRALKVTPSSGWAHQWTNGPPLLGIDLCAAKTCHERSAVIIQGPSPPHWGWAGARPGPHRAARMWQSQDTNRFSLSCFPDSLFCPRRPRPTS